ncbi:YraN family protein [bacterium]|nr:YraN family protein [bacterium]
MTYKRKIGKYGEDLAVDYLKSLQYQIVVRNYRINRGEIDIIARDKNTLVFVEVKTGSSDRFGSPELWVDRRKQVQIGRLAVAYCTKNHIEDTDCRFDVVAVTLDGQEPGIEHFKDAFWP